MNGITYTPADWLEMTTYDAQTILRVEGVRYE